MSRLDQLLQRIKEAGAPRESSHDRDGFLSYHAEAHAVGMGFAAGFVAATTGDERLIGVLLGVALYASRGESKLDAKIVEDVRQEPHYALGAIPLGYVAGVIAATGALPNDLPVVEWVTGLALVVL